MKNILEIEGYIIYIDFQDMKNTKSFELLRDIHCYFINWYKYFQKE